MGDLVWPSSKMIFQTFVNISRFSKRASASGGMVISLTVWKYFTSFKASVNWEVKEITD